MQSRDRSARARIGTGLSLLPVAAGAFALAGYFTSMAVDSKDLTSGMAVAATVMYVAGVAVVGGGAALIASGRRLRNGLNLSLAPTGFRLTF